MARHPVSYRSLDIWAHETTVSVLESELHPLVVEILDVVEVLEDGFQVLSVRLSAPLDFSLDIVRLEEKLKEMRIRKQEEYTVPV